MFYDLTTGIEPIDPRQAALPADTAPAPVGPVYWGEHTGRAVSFFEAGGVRLAAVPHLVVALAVVKDASAQADAATGRLAPAAAAAVSAVCQEIVDGEHRDQFVVDVRRYGAAVAVQWNADEVISNRAVELLGDDHDRTGIADIVRLGDLYPTTLRLAGIMAARDLLEDLRRLRRALQHRAESVEDSEDPVRLSLRSRLQGYAADLAEHELRLEQTIVGLYDVPVEDAGLVSHLSSSTGMSFRSSPDASFGDRGLLVVSRGLKPLAVRLAQLWSGLSALGAQVADGTARRPEMINRTALDVVAAVLQDELRDAEGPSLDNESATLLSVITSIGKLRDSADAIADWCGVPTDAATGTTLAA